MEEKLSIGFAGGFGSFESVVTSETGVIYSSLIVIVALLAGMVSSEWVEKGRGGGSIREDGIIDGFEKGWSVFAGYSFNFR